MMREPDKVLAVGDLHGNGQYASLALEYAYRNGCNAIVQVGDFGRWVPGDATTRYLDTVQRGAEECLARSPAT